MKKILAFFLFLFTFLLVYFGMNFYVFYRLYGFFGLEKDIIFYSIIGVLTLSYIISSIFERYHPNILNRAMYLLASVWMGYLFLMFFFMLIIEPFRFLTSDYPLITGISVISITSLFSVISMIIAFPIKVKIAELSFPRNIDAVLIADLHIGPIRGKKLLSKVVEMTNELKPDLVLIAGDLVDGSGPLDEAFFAPLLKLNAQAFFAAGNHEIYLDTEKIVGHLKKARVKVLDNTVVMHKGIQVVGVSHSDKKGHLGDALMQLNIHKLQPSILIFHPPKGVKDANEAGIDLMVSGHTHYGQIFPFNLLVKLFYRHIKGHYRYDKTHLYVSQGTGTWGPPMRLGSVNEITYLKLRKV